MKHNNTALYLFSILFLAHLVPYTCDGAFLPSAIQGQHDARLLTMTRTSATSASYTSLFASNNDEDKIAASLLEKASKLRKEATELEAGMDVSRRRSSNGNDNEILITKPKVTYTSLDDSSWEISFRFASNPPPSSSDDNDNDNDNGDSGNDNSTVQKFYSGKVRITLTPDGYTNIITSETNELEFVKFWGWDVENSNNEEDKGQEYISFSADTKLPTSDPTYEGDGIVRFYFNARVNRSSLKEITLDDGTVTVKRDVEAPGGFWGIFNAGGILAQFRYCGECLIKAC